MLQSGDFTIDNAFDREKVDVRVRTFNAPTLHSMIYACAALLDSW
jgi:hypothetical protein